MLNTLINNLKKYNNTWNKFNPSDADYDYNELFPKIDKFLKENKINIIHGYDHETLELEYIIYFNGEVVELGIDKVIFTNPYWNIIEECFKYLNKEI